MEIHFIFCFYLSLYSSNLLINSNIYLEFFGSFIYTYHKQWQFYFLHSNFCSFCYSFPFLIVLDMTSSKSSRKINVSLDIKYSCIVPDLKGKVVNTYPLRIIFTIVFHRQSLYQIKKTPCFLIYKLFLSWMDVGLYYMLLIVLFNCLFSIILLMFQTILIF